jgi:hypothetical protein
LFAVHAFYCIRQTSEFQFWLRLLLACYPLWRMAEKNESALLKISDRAPEFSLSAANREGSFSLSAIVQRGPAITEFLRGTW